jgi:phthalate 4,5-cis-dihydrodiol dehydrogenase
VRCITGKWDPSRPTEGAYTALLWFDDGVFASMTYSGYGHFDSDEWCGWTGELGAVKNPHEYGAARRRLSAIGSAEEEARLKAAGTYGGASYQTPTSDARVPPARHQHFGPVIVSCERGDLRPMPDGVAIYGDLRHEHAALPLPAVPRFEVVDELAAAMFAGKAPLHDGAWAKATLEICMAMLDSSASMRDVELRYQAVPKR